MNYGAEANLYIKQVPEEKGDCSFSPDMCFLHGESTERSYCHCSRVDPNSQDDISPNNHERHG